MTAIDIVVSHVAEITAQVFGLQESHFSFLKKADPDVLQIRYKIIDALFSLTV